MPIEDVFTITGRGTRRDRSYRAAAIVKVGETIEIVGHRPRRTSSTTVHRRRECSASCSTKGRAGDNVGVLLRGTKREDVAARSGRVASPGSITPHTQFEANRLTVPVEGRRRPAHAVLQQLPPAVSTSAPRTSPGVVDLPEGTEMVMPGDNTEMTVQLIQPIAMEEAFDSPSPRGLDATVGRQAEFHQRS